ncbi:MAG: tryptophan/tyrosine permease [Legionellales bacterium]|nr:tryptophan/tyrosine permease [Legionellales bacterium]
MSYSQTPASVPAVSCAKFDMKLLGGVFLVIGICIGGGMLALPLVNAPVGFVNSSVFLFLCWLTMTFGSLLILEVNSWLNKETNMISMAGKTLGWPGQLVAWASYLWLLYSLLSAYLAGGTDILAGLFALLGLPIATPWLTVGLTLLVALLVYQGVRWVDYVNRGLIFGKFSAYFLLLILIAPFLSLPLLMTDGETIQIQSALMVLITAFGFATIVPSLHHYFNRDTDRTRRVIIIGSFITLTFYIVWDLIIMGVIPREGAEGLLTIRQADDQLTQLAQSVQWSLDTPWITKLFRFFSSVCILTSFLGVSLCLFDFLADGLQMRKTGTHGFLLLLITFVPALGLVIFLPSIFIEALTYAGIACVILLLVLPIIMAWSGRYVTRISTGEYQVWGGKPLLISLSIVAVILVLFGIFEVFIGFY